MGEGQFEGFSKQSLHAQAPEVITSYPPTYLVGPLDTEASRVVLTQETEKVTVVLEEFPAEYMYSNPQGKFNLSVPEKQWKGPNFVNINYVSYRIKELREEAEATGA